MDVFSYRWIVLCAFFFSFFTTPRETIPGSEFSSAQLKRTSERSKLLRLQRCDEKQCTPSGRMADGSVSASDVIEIEETLAYVLWLLTAARLWLDYQPCICSLLMLSCPATQTVRKRLAILIN